MAVCGRGSVPITPICNTKLLMVPTNLCTKFQQDILIFIQVTACTDGRTDGQTDRHRDFNSSRHPDHIFIHI